MLLLQVARICRRVMFGFSCSRMRRSACSVGERLVGRPHISAPRGAGRHEATQTGMKSSPGPPATLGSTAEAHLRLIVWCKACRHQVEPDPAEMAERYGAEMTVPEWRKRLVCSQLAAKDVDMVVSGTKGR
jgi:hypothetical protein